MHGRTMAEIAGHEGAGGHALATRRSRARALALGASVLMGSYACGGKEQAAPADTTAPLAEVVAAEVSPAPPPSRLAEARPLIEGELTEANVGGALELADALSREDNKASRRTSVQLRLLAVARANELGKAELLAGGTEGQLRLALSALELMKPEDREPGQTATRALLTMFTKAGEGALPAGAIHGFLDEASPEGRAVKQALQARYMEARRLEKSEGFGAFAAAFGPLVCDGCGVLPEPAGEAPPGLRCGDGDKAVYCDGLTAGVAGGGEVAGQPGNRLAIAAMALAEKTGGDLAAVVGGVVLPVVSVVGRDLNLGAGALAPAKAPLTALIVSEQEVRVGLRSLEGDGAAKHPVREVGLAANGPLSLVELAERVPDKETGAIAGVTDKVTTVLEEVRGHAKEPLAPLGDGEAVVVAVAPSVDAGLLGKALDGVLAAGVQQLGFDRGGQHGEVMPALVRSAPEAVSKALSPAWDKAMVVVVSREAVDVYAPEGPKEGAKTPGPEAQGQLPTSGQAGWRGDKLVRLRVPRPPAVEGSPTWDPAVLRAVGEAVAAMIELHAAGRLLHVVAGEGATAGEVLALGRHLQEGGVGKEAFANPEEVWAGAKCRTKDCASLAPVLLSKAAVPNARGLKDKPDKGKKPPADKPEPGPAPSDEFCNKADIKSQMAKKTAGFRFCYERELQLEKDLEGRITMSFVIGTSGQVKSVRVSNNALGSAKVAECLTKEIGKIQFKAPDGGECVVQWPFSFRKN